MNAKPTVAQSERGRACDWIYPAIVILLPISQRILRDQFWLSAVLSSFYIWFFLPLPFLLVRSLFRRDRNRMLGLLPVLAIGLWIWGPQWLPNFNSNPRERDSIGIMSYNLLFSNEDGAQIEQVIRFADPAVIGFQELSRGHEDRLLSGLGADYPHNTFNLPVRGVGLMSRYPILESSALDFPPRHLALQARIDHPDGPITVFVIHFRHNGLTETALAKMPAMWTQAYATRAAEVQQFLALVAATDGPLLLLCDCNMTETSTTYGQLAAQLQDSFRAAGWGLGYTLHPEPAPTAIERIDYIWASEHFGILTSRVLGRGGSDHHPVFSEIFVRGVSLDR